MASKFAGRLPSAVDRDVRGFDAGDGPPVPRKFDGQFPKNQKQVQEVIETAITSGPFGHIAKQNIEFMRSAREALMPNLAGKKPEKAESIDDLKKQMADLQAKIDKLSAD